MALVLCTILQAIYKLFTIISLNLNVMYNLILVKLNLI